MRFQPRTPSRRKWDRTALMQILLGKPKTLPIDTFRAQNCLRCEVPIEFLGVWDTVDAVGTPFHISDIINVTFHRYKFPDSSLNPCVKKACQALAIDETRDAFSPELWTDDPRIEQVWFS